MKMKDKEDLLKLIVQCKFIAGFLNYDADEKRVLKSWFQEKIRGDGWRMRISGIYLEDTFSFTKKRAGSISTKAIWQKFLNEL